MTLRYARAPVLHANDSEQANRTVAIDAESGRVRSVTDVWIDANGDRVARTMRFTDDGSTTVDPPNAPIWSVQWHLHDLYHGPLTRDVPL